MVYTDPINNGHIRKGENKRRNNFLSPIFIIHPVSSPWIVEVHGAFGAGKLTASALKASFVIMFDFSLFKGKSL